MTQYVINIGALPNDGTGDPLRTAFNDTNLNFDQVFAAGPVLSNVRIANNTILTTNTNGNLVLAPNGVGRIQANASILPSVANVRDLGSLDRRWNTVYSQYLDISGQVSLANLTVNGNLTVDGDIIQIGNLVTDAKTIQLANTAGTANAADGSGITVGALDNIATMLYSSATNAWTFNIGVDAPNIVVNNITSDDSTFVTVQDGLDVQGDITAETVSVTGNVTGGNLLAPGAVIATLLTGGNLQVTGGVSGSTMTAVANVTGGNILTGGLISATGNITGNYILGNISQASGFPATYGNANVATFLAAYGSNTISTSGNITGNYFVGNGSLLTSLTGANVTGTVANATSATTAGTVTSNAQANITSVGTLTSLSSSGNITGGNVLTGGLISATGNITSGNINTGKITLTNGAVIKDNAGDSVAFGQSAGATGQGEFAVAIGYLAGNASQGNAAVAIGASAGQTTQGVHAVAIGTDTGATTQGNRAVAIGYLAGSNAQGTAAVAIGYYAGELNQGNNSIIINATDTSLQQTTANTFTVAPVRNDVANTGQVMFYNTTSKEITYGNTISVAGNITGAYVKGNGSELTSLPAPTVTQDITSNGAMSIMTYDGVIKYVSYATVEPSSGNITGGNLLTGGQIISTGVGNATTNGGQIFLNGATLNRIDWNTNGTGAPEYTTRSAGAKVVLYPAIGGSATDYALGVEAGALWSGIPGNDGGQFFKWYGGNVPVASLSGTGVFSATGNITGGNIVTDGNITGNTAGFAIGYRDIPQVSLSANATIATTDAGKHFYSTSASNLILTIANNASQGFQIGAAITIVNQGAGTISIAQGSGVTLYLAGNVTAGNRTISTFGMATCIKVAADTWFINGTGVS